MENSYKSTSFPNPFGPLESVVYMGVHLAGFPLFAPVTAGLSLLLCPAFSALSWGMADFPKLYHLGPRPLPSDWL